MDNTPVSLRPLLIDSEVERALKVHDGWCGKDRLRDQPRIPFARFGRAIRYRPEDVQAYISACMSGAQSAA